MKTCVNRIAAALVISLVAATSGCTRDDERSTARLAGVVTVDGQPLAEGQVQFLPEGANQGQPAAAEINSGRYECSKVAMGKVRVLFFSETPAGEAVELFGRRVQPTRNVIPNAYRDGLSIDVAGDNDAANFKLSSNEG